VSERERITKKKERERGKEIDKRENEER